MNNYQVFKGVGLSLLGYFLLACTSACVKAAPHVPTSMIVFLQFFTAFLLTLPKMQQVGWHNVKTTRVGLILVRCLTGLLSMSAMYYAIKHIPLVNAVLLQNTIPLFVPLVMWLGLKKLIPHKLWFSIILGFIGVALILKPSASIISFPALIGLSAGVLTAISVIALGLLRTTEPTNRIIFYFFLVGSFVTAPIAVLNWTHLSLANLAILVASGALLYASVLLVTHSFKFAKATILAPMSYSTVIFTGLIGWAVWHHIPDALSFCGIALVIIGGVATIALEQKSAQKEVACRKPSKNLKSNYGSHKVTASYSTPSTR